MNLGHNKRPGEHIWIKYKWSLSFLAKLGLTPKLLPLLTHQQRLQSSFVTYVTKPQEVV